MTNPIDRIILQTTIFVWLIGIEFYSPETAIAIARYLRALDHQHNSQIFTHDFLTGEFQRRFGKLNYAGIEVILRFYEMNTHLLAAVKVATI